MATKKNPSGLTQKQETFCQCIVDGMTGKDAYKTAYNSNCGANTAYTEACKLLSRDDIKNYINSLRMPLEIAYKANILSESDRIKQCLWDIINNPDEKTENQIRAMDILNRMNQAYTDSSTDSKQENDLTNIDSNQLIELIKAG